MGKMDDLEYGLLAAEAAERSAKIIAEKFASNAAEIRKKMAAFKTAESKPRRFQIAIDRDGSPIAVCGAHPGALMELTIKAKLPALIIKAIEEKPLVITKAMARAAFHAAVRAEGRLWTDLSSAVAYAKALGCDAIAADE